MRNVGWSADVWARIVRQALGHLVGPEPDWYARPALSQHSYATAALARVLPVTDDRYHDRIKPFNFCVLAQVGLMGAPEGADPQRCHLIAPYERDPSKWLQGIWTDLYSGVTCRATTGVSVSGREAEIRSIGEVLQAYAEHPESKSLGPDGKECGRFTVGLLQVRHVVVGTKLIIGKEANHLEEQEVGLIDPVKEHVQVFKRARGDVWAEELQPALIALRTAEVERLASEIGVEARTVWRWRRPGGKPGRRYWLRVERWLREAARSRAA